jgi:hypothetical protein
MYFHFEGKNLALYENTQLGFLISHTIVTCIIIHSQKIVCIDQNPWQPKTIQVLRFFSWLPTKISPWEIVQTQTHISAGYIPKYSPT